MKLKDTGLSTGIERYGQQSRPMRDVILFRQDDENGTPYLDFSCMATEIKVKQSRIR